MLWIVGKTFQEFERYLVAHAIPFGLLHDTALAPQKTSAQHVIPVTFVSKQQLIGALADSDLDPSGFILSGYEQYVSPLAWLCELYDLPGPTEAAALAATDKSVMRQAFWTASPTIAPEWQVVHSAADLRAFVATHGYPVVLKPTNLAKSLFVSINTDAVQLKSQYQATAAALADSRSSLLVEAFMSGSMHTVTGFVNQAGDVQLSDVIVDCLTAKDRGRDDSYIAERTIPSSLDSAAVERILEVGRQGVRALGLTSVSLHIEIMLTADGPKIIEIAARLGGYRARMYELAVGTDLYAGAVATALGQTVNLTTRHAGACTVIEIFPEQTGELQAITNLAELRQLPAVEYVAQKRAIGAVVGRAKDGHKACAVVIISSQDQPAVQAAVAYVHEQVRVLVR